MDTQNKPSIHIDVYEIVTNRIIELLEAGTIPWQQPWGDGGMPRNLISKHPYRGINLWLLQSLNYEQSLFLTFKQLKSLGGSVLQGEHGHLVVFWKAVKKKPEELDEKGNPKTIGMLRYYKVFNVSQCKDIPDNFLKIDPLASFDPLLECEMIVKDMPDCPVIRHSGQRAFYNIKEDYICMPLRKTFLNPEGYYSTLFHELVHSTGAEKRLNRKSLQDMAPFGSESYAMEELVAEIGSAYLCHFAEILPNEIQNTVAYLKGWLKVLRGDKKFILLAASQSQKAIDLILNLGEANNNRF